MALNQFMEILMSLRREVNRFDGLNLAYMFADNRDDKVTVTHGDPNCKEKISPFDDFPEGINALREKLDRKAGVITKQPQVA
jgi:hypothetical protein